MRNSLSVLATPLVDKTAVDPDQLALSEESRKGYETESYAHTYKALLLSQLTGFTFLLHLPTANARIQKFAPD